VLKTALTIAGSDSSGGAGIQADIKTFQALGVFGMSAVTAVTVQNTRQVYAIQEISPAIVAGQIRCLFEDIEIHAVKIGMVASIPLIEAVARSLAQVRLPPVVLDPVMVSKSGCRLLDPDAQAALVAHLFPLATVVTPNLHEAEALTGRKIATVEEMKSAADDIRRLGAGKVVVKGGHLSGRAVDIVFDGHRWHALDQARIASRNTHGTGCTFSAAIAAHLARGADFIEAVKRAKAYVAGAIAHGLPIGGGVGPTHHFFDLYARAGFEGLGKK
jgi:hydroxymethylpyrimidine/phosphomethylpyrimidine kinase